MSSKQIKIGALVSYVGVIGSVIISLAYTPFMLRKLGEVEYGIFSLVNSIVAYLTILDFGFGNAIVRYVAKYRIEKKYNEEKSLYGMFLIIYSIIGIISLVCGIFLIYKSSEIFSKSFSAKEIKLIEKMMWIAIINISLNFPFSIFASIMKAYEKLIIFKIIDLFKICLTPILMVILLTFGYKALEMLTLSFFLTMVANIYSLWYCFKKLNIKIIFRNFDKKLISEITKYSFFIFLNLIIDRLYWTTDKIILGIYKGAASIAVYSIGLNIYNCYMQLSTSLSGLFLTKIIEINYQENSKEKLSELFIKIGRIQFILLSLVLSGFIIFGKEFVIFLAGKEYIEAYYIAIIVMIPAIIPLSQNIAISVLQAQNKHAFRSVLYLFIAILNVLLSIFLVEKYGVIGCTIATSIATILGQIIIMNVYYWKKINLEIPKYWFRILKIAAIVTLLTVIGYKLNVLTEKTGIIELTLKGILYGGFFMLVLWITEISKEEKIKIRELIWRG